MPNFGEFVVSNLPGASRGYCQVVSPGLDKGHLRQAKLAPAVLDAVKAGTLTLNNGVFVAIDKAAPNAGYKIATPSGGTADATHVPATAWAAGAFPILVTTDAPSVLSSGGTAIFNWANASYESDQVGSTAGIAAGRYLKTDNNGKLVDDGTTRTISSVGKTVSIDPNVPSQSDQSVFVSLLKLVVFGQDNGF